MTGRSGRRVLGADGASGGWVVVVLVDGEVDEVVRASSLANAISDAGPLAAAAVDMPIGLVDEPRRDAEVAARAMLPGRGSTVFGVPCRTVVEAWRDGRVTDHAGATALQREVTGSGLSIQSWGLVPRIAEVDALLADHPGLLEVHPETAFRALDGAPLPRKTSWSGLARRRELLATVGVTLPTTFPGGGEVAPDDVVDAAAVAWVADGWPHATRTLPPEPTQWDGDRAAVMTVRDPS